MRTEELHQRVRLSIAATLSRIDSATFTYLRETLNLTAGNLSRHLQVLEVAGLVEVTRSFVGRRPRMRVALTDEGRAALRQAIHEINAIVEDADV